MIPWLAFALTGILFTIIGGKFALSKNDTLGMAGLALLILGPGLIILGLLGVRATLM